MNYRHEDTWGQALLLRERLAEKFGSENIFLDLAALQPGMRWVQEIKRQRDACAVLLVLVGPSWQQIMTARRQAAVAQPAEDYVRFEIESALRPGSGIRVLPVLVGDAVPFAGERLPRSLRALTEIQAELIRPQRVDDDIAHLIRSLDQIAAEHSQAREEESQAEAAPAPPAGQGRDAGAGDPDAAEPPVPAPDRDHYDLVLRHMLEDGSVVPFLGSRLAGRHAGPAERAASPLDEDDLAARLAERFGMKAPRPDLPVIAQYVYLTIGRPDLCREVAQILEAGSEPGPVHKFLAGLPGVVAAQGGEPQYQLIVSTSFDAALERAFEDAGEPYDLAVFMVSGRDKGKFVHFPYGGDPEPISVPNAYGKLPIGDYGELERTLIVKIHGAVDRTIGDYRWRENYVITEDHYIDYLSRSPIENLVPVQILDKLSQSHCLFLGYTVREWNLRVFLKRIWGEPLGAKSWAVKFDPDALEREFWKNLNVDLYAADLTDYVNRLDERLAARAPR